MFPNNPSQPDNRNSFSENNDEISLADLGIFDDDVPVTTPTNSGSSQSTASAVASNPKSSTVIALSELPLLDEPERIRYVEIETLSEEDLEGKLACGICYQPYYPQDFTVVSKERINFEAAVVVCPNCLADMQAEVRRRTAGADLTLGLIWGIVTTLIFTSVMCWLIWAQRDSTAHTWWWWIGFFLSILPGFIIGKAVYIGVGRKSSRRQQILALVLTIISIYTQFYVAQLAWYNFLDDIQYTIGHNMDWVDPAALSARMVVDFIQAGPLVSIAIVLAGLLGLATAWFVSQGPRLYTRPFVQSELTRKSWLAKTREFLNV